MQGTKLLGNIHLIFIVNNCACMNDKDVNLSFPKLICFPFPLFIAYNSTSIYFYRCNVEFKYCKPVTGNFTRFLFPSLKQRDYKMPALEMNSEVNNQTHSDCWILIQTGQCQHWTNIMLTSKWRIACETGLQMEEI